MITGFADLYVNDLPLHRLGIQCVRLADGGWKEGLKLAEPAIAIPGRVGLLRGGRRSAAPRTVRVNLYLEQASPAALKSALHELKDLFQRGLVELRFADEPSLMLVATPEELSVVVTPPGELAAVGTQLQLIARCQDPYQYTKLGQVVGFTTVKSPMPLGTAPSLPILRILGNPTANVVNPGITYRGASGIALKTMGFTITLGANDFLEINCDTFQISKSVSGVVTDAFATLTSGDFLVLDPQDGDYNNAIWPTLELSAGSGEAVYRRTWL